MTTYETSGSLTTDTWTSDGEATEIYFNVTHPPNTDIDATIKQDQSGGTVADSTRTIHGVTSGTYSLSGFTESSGASYWITFDVSTSDTSTTPSVDDVTLTTTQTPTVTGTLSSSVSGDDVTLSLPSVDWGGEEGTYEILRGESSGSLTQYDTTDSGNTEYVDTGLEDGERFYYAVRPTNTAGDGDASNETNERTALPTPTIGSPSTSDGSVTVPWTKNDDSPDGGWDVERSNDGGSTWTTIVSGLTASTSEYTDDTVSGGETYEYRTYRYTDHTNATTPSSDSIRAPKLLTRTTTVSGGGVSTTSRGELSKARTTSIESTGRVSASRSTSRTRSTTTEGDGGVDTTRRTDKLRVPTLTATGGHSSTQTLRPVFPDERALDVQWDFSAEHMGFATEWLDEDSIIDREIRDGIGVVLGGDLSTTIEVFIEYDEDGDGTADVTSEVKNLGEAYHTLAFDSDDLFGEDGWYRVIVRGLRAYDTINQVDIGAVHANL